MRIHRTEVLIDEGGFSSTQEFATLMANVSIAVKRVVWPVGSKTFNLNPTRKGNGVKPIKSNCMIHLQEHKWILEHRMMLGSRSKPGPVDAVKQLGDGRFFAVEWETGNISSSHRAMNKLAIGLLDGVLAGGVLILPSRPMYEYLTDRVGNFAELEPYFKVWRNLSVTSGYLAVMEIEPDTLDASASLIPKGSDGWALLEKH